MTKQELFNQVKVRKFPEKNYHAIWHKLQTIRIGKGKASELEPEYSEFFDVSLGNRCQTGKCPWCYVNSSPNGQYYTNVSETWKRWMATFPEDRVIEGTRIILTKKPTQIAIGSEGCPLENPEFCDFIETVFNTGVVPNYTTNGVILSYWNKPGTKYYELANKVLEYTNKYVGGVAVSFGNKSLRKFAEEAIEGLLAKGNCKINIHHLISDVESVNDFIDARKKYGKKIYYHVLLPLMPSGRSTESMSEEAWDYLENLWNYESGDPSFYDLTDIDYAENVSFGAHLYERLKKSKHINSWLYAPESFSKNIILKDNKVTITPSSFDLNPIKVIEV